MVTKTRKKTTSPRNNKSKKLRIKSKQNRRRNKATRRNRKKIRQRGAAAYFSNLFKFNENNKSNEEQPLLNKEAERKQLLKDRGTTLTNKLKIVIDKLKEKLSVSNNDKIIRYESMLKGITKIIENDDPLMLEGRLDINEKDVEIEMKTLGIEYKDN